jgi:hypothetical protein
MPRIKSHEECRHKLHQPYQSYAEGVFGKIIHLPANDGGLHVEHQYKKESCNDVIPELRVAQALKWILGHERLIQNEK